jgi:hypothetical protein
MAVSPEALASKGERALAAKLPVMPDRYAAARDRAIAGYRAVGFLDTFVRAYTDRWPSMIESYKDVVRPGLERKWRERWLSKMFGR